MHQRHTISAALAKRPSLVWSPQPQPIGFGAEHVREDFSREMQAHHRVELVDNTVARAEAAGAMFRESRRISEDVQVQSKSRH